MKVGFIGLGKMGSRMAGKLLSERHSISVWNRSADAISNFKFQISNDPNKDKALFAGTIEKLVKSLPAPKIVWIMVPAAAVEEVLSEVKKYISAGDVVIDGGNSNYKDTQVRFEDFEKEGIHFLGIGTSGGILAGENGYPFMAGGSREGYELIKPVLDSLSKPHGGHEYFGTGGAGHFVKMVHNGIEYGIMQSLGEGFEVLEKSTYKFDLPKIAKLWQKGTLVSGFMLDRAHDALEKDPTLSDLSGVINSSGEAQWTIDTAKEENVDVEIIKNSLDYRKRSQTDEKIQKSFTARLIAALRREFGGHPVQNLQGEEVKKEG